MNQILIKRLVEMEDLVVPALFKPVQFGILKKLNACKKLTENENRYLRGKMKAKLNILMRFIDHKAEENEDYMAFLDNSLHKKYRLFQHP